MQDYSTTFNRLFGEGEKVKAPAWSSPRLFWEGNRTSQSPQGRGRVRATSQDARWNPTTAITKTTHQDLAVARRASPRPLKRLLGLRGAGMDSLDVWHKDQRDARADHQAARNSSTIWCDAPGDTKSSPRRSPERNQSNILRWELVEHKIRQDVKSPRVRNQENNVSVFSEKAPARASSPKPPIPALLESTEAGPTLLAGGSKGTLAPSALG
ncbi:unnamed protein product, partial [Effrenium voratum]